MQGIATSNGRPLSLKAVDSQLLNDLVAGRYTGGIILSYGAGLFVGPNLNKGLKLQVGTYPWILANGTYGNATLGYHLTGYRIYKYDVNRCWQAVGANGPIALWNGNGLARGKPQDWELFKFEIINAQQGSVRIKNVWGRYVHRTPPDFSADLEVSAGANTFWVDFCPKP